MKKTIQETIPTIAFGLPDAVRAFHESGYFDREIRTIDRLLARDDCSEAMRDRLSLQRQIAEQMKCEYDTTPEEALEEIRRDIPDFTEEELEGIFEDSLVDWHMVNGKPMLQSYFMESFYTRRPDLKARRVNVRETGDPNAYREDNHSVMEKNGYRAFRHRIRLEIEPREEAAIDGEEILVHLPYPAICPEQSDIVLHDMTPGGVIAGDVQRTVSWKQVYHKGDKFFVEFSFTNRAKYTRLDPDAVSADQPDFHTDELPPHITFTPYLRALAAEIAGEETNPLILARRVYDYLAHHLHYSYTREYVLLEPIADTCALNMRGDCGVMALTFITLCRILGIPARWQSGLSVHPGHIGRHDWAQFYVAPYGWLYADLSYSVGAVSVGSDVRLNHYFGNLDPFRMVTCNNVQGEFVPAKKYLRADPFDNQRGEIEFASKGLNSYEIRDHRYLISCEEVFD